MGVFPGSAAPAPSSSYVVIPRHIGTVNLNDRVNTWFDQITSVPFALLSQFEQVINNGGQMVRVRRDKKAQQPLADVLWIDGGGRVLTDFYDSLMAVDGGELDLGAGWKWAQADVLDVIEKRVSVQFADGNLVEAWRCNLKFQCYSASRIA